MYDQINGSKILYSNEQILSKIDFVGKLYEEDTSGGTYSQKRTGVFCTITYL